MAIFHVYSPRLVLVVLVVLGAGLGVSTDKLTDIGSARPVEEYLKKAESLGIINAHQLLKLRELAQIHFMNPDPDSERAGGRDPIVKNEPDERTSVFLHVYNHLTLLNVLYLSGAVIIMGAYTFFMTLAVEKCNYSSMGLIMLVQVAVLGCLGVVSWGSVSFVYVGGILCTLSTSMVPFTVYNIQRALGVWPKEDPGVFVGFTQWIRSGWIIMEITTVVMGVAYLSMVRFPFLLFPISFSLWYLSMDLAPLVPGWRISSYTTIRIRISIAMGIAIMLLGYTSETVLGSNPDLGFWLYFFGLLTFCVALNFDFPSSDLYGSLFLLVNMGLVLIGSHLNRTTFHVFGTLGVIEYVVGIYSMRIKTSDSIVLWLLKALVAASLFSQAVSRHGNIEVLGGIVCVLAFNFNFIHFITSSEFYSLLLLTANLGFVSTSSLFSQSLDLWLFILPNIQYLFGLLTSLMVILFHAKIAVKYLKTIPTGLEAHSFLLYRFFSSVALAFVFVFLRQPHLAWIGALGITMAPLCYSQPSFNNNTHQQYKRIHRTITFIGLLFSVSFSIFLDSNILYLISCVVLLITTTSLLSDLKIQGCAFAVLLVLASIPLNSKFLITIGALYIISYLTHLAYNTFRDSLMFPLVLIGLGAVMIASAVQYQQFESDIHAGFDSIIPHTLKALLLRNIHSFWKEGSVTDWISFISKTRFSMASFMQLPFCWVLWPGAMMYALVAGPAPYVAYFCVLCILLVVTMAAVMSWREKMVRHLDDQLEVEGIKFSLSKKPEHKGHGIVIEIKGSKPSRLGPPPHLALDVPLHSSFWNAAKFVYGEFAISVARSMFLPYKLTPHLISLDNFSEGKNKFAAIILLGTGHKGSHKMKHSTATNALQKLVPHSSIMQCVVMYKDSWYKPWSRLCTQQVDLKETLDNLRQS